MGIAAIVLSTGCGGGEKKKGAYLDRCEVADDCEDPLSCQLGRCTRYCTYLTDAGAGVCVDLHAICAGTACFPPCQGGSDCFHGLQCYVTSQPNVHACQPPEDEIPEDPSAPPPDDFGNVTPDASAQP
jgi:hypothetical protein